MKWITIKDSTTKGNVEHKWRLVEQRLTAISGVQNRLSVACSTQHPLEVQNKHLPIEFQERSNYTIANVDEAIGWLQKLASSLNQQMNNVDKSVYMVFKINGEQKVLRIANHRGNAREFADRGEFKGNLGIVIKMDEKQFQADNRVEYKEEVFFPDKLDDSKLDQIISGAKHFIQTGEYNGPSGDQINISPKQSSQATSKQSNKQITKENTMKKLNITKEQFNRSKYLQNKYGTLEYVSESGKIFKTSKGKLLKFSETANVPMRPLDDNERPNRQRYRWIIKDYGWCQGPDCISKSSFSNIKEAKKNLIQFVSKELMPEHIEYFMGDYETWELTITWFNGGNNPYKNCPGCEIDLGPGKHRIFIVDEDMIDINDFEDCEGVDFMVSKDK